MTLLLLAPIGLALALLFVWVYAGWSLRKTLKKEKDEHEDMWR